MNTLDAVRAVVRAAPDAHIVSSLGTPTSALIAASGDGPHLYLGGSMGCGLPVALGVAEHCPEREFIACVGDGDLLMGAGALWSLSQLRPPNLAVVVLSNNAYAITGGQPLVAEPRFAAVLEALGGAVARACDPEGIEASLAARPRPTLLEVELREHEWPGPSPFVDPHRVVARFRESLRRVTR